MSIHNEVVPPAAFHALLAEAEAALVHDPALPAAHVPEPEPEPQLAPAPVPAPERIPDLCTRLRALGVPDVYLPQGLRPTLDALACAMGTLPRAPAPAAGAGAIVLVVGAPGLVDQTTALLADVLGLGRRDLVQCDVQSVDNDDSATAGTGAAKLSAAVRVAKRRASGLISLVGLTTSPDADGSAAAADVIDCLRPHTVLATVEASVKRVDTERWLQGVGPVDALAVWGLDATGTPGELLGAAPIAYADGTACTAISWTATLLARLAGDDLAGDLT